MITKTRSWMMLALLAPVLMLGACGGDDNSTTPTPVPTPTPISLTGNWSMTGNTSPAYPFTLSITQAGASISGVMDSLNTKEANTPIDGAFDGTTLTFVRHGASYTQVYAGTVSAGGNKLSGTYSHNNSASIYVWSATRQ